MWMTSGGCEVHVGEVPNYKYMHNKRVFFLEKRSTYKLVVLPSNKALDDEVQYDIWVWTP